MSDYLVPCSCGRRVTVSQAMAGQSVPCSCGNQVEVPTLRELRQLDRAMPLEGAKGARTWSDRHRAVYLWIVAMTGAAALGVFLLMARPPEPQANLVNVGGDWTANLSAEQVMGAFEILKQGIQVQGSMYTPGAKEAMQRRTQMTWGMRIAFGLSLCAAIGAAVTLMTARRQHDESSADK